MDKVVIGVDAAVEDALSKIASLESALLRLGGQSREVSTDFDHLSIDWEKYTIQAQNAENETVKFINTTNGLSNVFSRVRNELEAIEVAWGQALVEDSKRAQKAIDDLNKSLADNAKAEQAAATEADKLAKAWDAAIVENAKRAEKAADDASRSSLQAANAFRSPWQAVSTGLQTVEAEFGVIGIAAGLVAAGLVVVAKAAYDLVDSTGQAAIETANLATRLGVTNEAALKLDAATKIVGISAQAFETNIRFLAQALDDTSGAGNKTLTAIRSLGIETITANGAQREMGVIFEEILSKLSQITDKNERAAKAIEIFHRNAMQIIPLIDQYDQLNAAVGDLGVGAHEGLTAALKAQGEEVNKLNIAWQTFKNEIAAAIGPAVMGALFLVTENLKGIAIGMKGWIDLWKDLTDQSRYFGQSLLKTPVKVELADKAAPAAYKAAADAYIAGQGDMKEALQQHMGVAKKAWEDELVHAKQVHSTVGESQLAIAQEDAKVAHLRAEYEGLKGQLDAIKAAEEAARKAKTLELETQRELNRLTEENIRAAGDASKAWEKADAAGRNKKEGPQTQLPVFDASRSMEAEMKAEVAIAAAASDLRQQVAQREHAIVASIFSKEVAEYEEALHKMGAANDKFYADQKKLEEKGFLEEQTSQNRELTTKIHNWEAALTAYNKYQADLRHAADEATVTLIENNNKQYAIQKAAIEEQAKLFQITPKQRAQQENQAAQKTYQANLGAANDNYNALVANPDASEEEKERAAKRLTDVISAEQKRQEAIVDESVKTEIQIYDKAWTQVQGTFDRFVTTVISGHDKIGQSFSKLERGMLADAAKTALNIGLTWAKMELGRVIFHQAANNQMSIMDIIKQQLGIAKAVAAETEKKAAVAAVDAGAGAADAAAGAAKVAAGAPARIASVEGDAAVAGAAAAAWTAAMGAPEAAPEAGAAMYALISGLFGPLAAFEQGGLVPDNQLAFLHKNEMVLPANISKGVQGMINGGSAGGRALTLHYHGYKGQDQESMKNDAGMIGKHIKKLARQGRL